MKGTIILKSVDTDDNTTMQHSSITLNGLPKGVYAVQLGQLGSTLIRK